MVLHRTPLDCAIVYKPSLCSPLRSAEPHTSTVDARYTLQIARHTFSPNQASMAPQSRIDEIQGVLWPVGRRQEECCICRMDMVLPVELACQGVHVFCRSCITTWLKENSRCPVCREEVLALLAGEYYDDDEEQQYQDSEQDDG